MPVGNMLEEVTSGCIIQQANAQGVMGSGIAWAIREKWPVVWTDYSSIVKQNPTFEESAALLGNVVISDVSDDLVVASIVGQQFYGKPVPQDPRRYTSYDAVDIALNKLAEHYRDSPVVFHYPLLGSDRGGAHWPIVQEIIMHRLEGFEHHLWRLNETEFPARRK